MKSFNRVMLQPTNPNGFPLVGMELFHQHKESEICARVGCVPIEEAEILYDESQNIIGFSWKGTEK